MYIGHKSDDGREQSLKEHLEGVAKLAKTFAAPFSGQAHAERTGTLHDAGKYSEAGQKRMNDPEHTAKVDHATAGARIALEQLKDPCGASAIAGHHGGMPDLGNKLSGEENPNGGKPTVYGRVKKDLSGRLDASAFWQENVIEKDNGKIFPEWLQKERLLFSWQFYTRMLFSCLVDADFLNTETFMKKGEKPEDLRGHYASLKDLKPRFDQYTAELKEKRENEINNKRNEILNDCLDAGTGKPGLYSLTVPTGGGKTISSLAFAMNHAEQNGMKRIIYVIPYTSIIEQNAKVFREILGDENVIEHHSGILVDEDEKNTMDGNEALRRKMLATENWDAPVIVTTAVQFFDSLFSNKPSKCRKLHSIADSVVIFDEAQMIPLAYLKPCVCAIGELVRHYHVTAVLCTATQPSLNRMFSDYDKTLTVREICHDVAALQTFFRRVHFEDAGQMDMDSVAEALTRQNQVLCIVNKKISAQQIFQKLPKDGRYHLSTWMTPDHRTKVLKEIKERLKNGLACRVVSTNLMEAGVDVDFPQVWRGKAGLDSILQAAGRCNREGKHSAEESKVILFTLEGGVPKFMRPNLEAANIALEEAAYPDESSTIESYFNQLYRLRTEDAMDTKKILEKCNDYEFETIAKHFHLIDSDTYTIYIPTDYNAADLKALEEGKCSRALMRRLGRSVVNVQWWDWDKLDKANKLDRLDEYSAILRDPKNDYNEQFGLKLDVVTGLGIMEE